MASTEPTAELSPDQWGTLVFSLPRIKEFSSARKCAKYAKAKQASGRYIRVTCQSVVKPMQPKKKNKSPASSMEVSGLLDYYKSSMIPFMSKWITQYGVFDGSTLKIYQSKNAPGVLFSLDITESCVSIVKIGSRPAIQIEVDHNEYSWSFSDDKPWRDALLAASEQDEVDEEITSGNRVFETVYIVRCYKK
jgi:hypothetical protein